MLKGSLLKTVIKSNHIVRIVHQNQGLASILRDSLRRFSTEAEEPGLGASSDSFLEVPNTGLVYGRLTGIARNTTKSDIVNLLEGCNLTMDDVKVDYNRAYSPVAMMVQFPSRSAYDAAIRAIGRKGRLYKLERIPNRSQWDLIVPYDGKAILLQGIPRNALQDDVERFLYGCQYDATSIQMFVRPASSGPIKMALARFPSKTQAMHAFLTKNRGFCLNNQISMRVLQ
ncbi:unnamed protein product [Ilex paraguariensis]|uniref:Uncharacterized protein n=1 Tax=Ilex paraguariensis TaxID=185542 RepID=A0ABC8TD10_9AQUA